MKITIKELINIKTNIHQYIQIKEKSVLNNLEQWKDMDRY